MNDEKIPRHMPDYHLEDFGEELVLYHPVKTRAMHLNGTAALVWRLCDGRRTVGEIKGILGGAFPPGGDSIAGDIDDVLRQFLENEVLELL